MQMTLRWYGSKFDTVTLEQIRQIPGVHGVITTLYDKQPGELWKQDEIHALKEEVEASGLQIAGIESVNVSDAIKDSDIHASFENGILKIELPTEAKKEEETKKFIEIL